MPHSENKKKSRAYFHRATLKVSELETVILGAEECDDDKPS